jgi:hypothetical protein
VIDPFYPSDVIPGVTSVFKRFFGAHCEVQILLNEEHGNQLWSGNQTIEREHAGPMQAQEAKRGVRAMDMLRRVANLILAPGPGGGDVAFATAEALQEALLGPSPAPAALSSRCGRVFVSVGRGVFVSWAGPAGVDDWHWQLPPAAGASCARARRLSEMSAYMAWPAGGGSAAPTTATVRQGCRRRRPGSSRRPRWGCSRSASGWPSAWRYADTTVAPPPN